MPSMIIQCHIGSIWVSIQPIKKLHIHHSYRASNCHHCDHHPTYKRMKIKKINGKNLALIHIKANTYTTRCLTMMPTTHKYLHCHQFMGRGNLDLIYFELDSKVNFKITVHFKFVFAFPCVAYNKLCKTFLIILALCNEIQEQRNHPYQTSMFTERQFRRANWRVQPPQSKYLAVRDPNQTFTMARIILVNW